VFPIRKIKVIPDEMLKGALIMKRKLGHTKPTTFGPHYYITVEVMEMGN
jgi:hypothetical protein